MAKDYFIELENDKIEEEQEQETLDWIEEDMRREAEEEAAKAAEEAKKKEEEEQEQWMIDQLKKEYGDDFGEDIDIDFSG
jgi:hypothetical protein